MDGQKIIALAQSRGSRATTRDRAWRYLLTHIPRRDDLCGWSSWLRWRPDTQWPYRYKTQSPHMGMTRTAYYDLQHRKRLDARYTQLGTEWLAATGLRPLDPKRENARVRRFERQAELRGLRESNEEREFLAAGYALVRDGAHRKLTGMDDGHPFEVHVPLRCQTIGEALGWLRPDGVDSDTPRQGEWFFVPATLEPEGETETEAGSWRRVQHHSTTTFDRRRRHMPDECIVVVANGSTCFLGRKAVHSHAWTGRPCVYVRGVVRHPEHDTVDLGDRWHEVIPNRAHGPFDVGSLGVGGID